MQREHTLLQATVGLCPECLRRLDAKVVARAGRAWLWRFCPEHGEQCDLLEEDASWLAERDRFAKPATVCATQTSTTGNCPFDCGLCQNHEQHTCIALIEITGKCDLQCPVCYASSGQGSFLPLETIERMLDFAIESEGGTLEILQISGGEPTLHPQLPAIISMARAKPVKYILLNTHGLHFTRNPDLVRALSEYPDRFEVYLQFDGVHESAHEQLRGRPLAGAKQEALEILSANRIPTCLVMSVQDGLNDDQLGAVVVRGLQTPHVRGVSFQPVAWFGRQSRPCGRAGDRMARATLSGIVQKLESQMSGMIRKEHMIPLPCDPDRVAIGYFHKARDGGFSPLVTRAEVLANMAHIGNTLRFTPEEFISSIALAKGSPRSIVPPCGTTESCCGLAGKLGRFFPPSFFSARSVREKALMVSQTTFRITITSFLDAFNFDLRSCQRECVHVITPGLKKIPFSAFNIYHRERLAGL